MTVRLLAALVGAPLLCAQSPGVKIEDPSVIARGRSIFGASCGIGYCHGKDGQAGRGPRLAGRKWEKEYLFKAISGGVNNSLMPAFRDQLSADEIWTLVAYILSLSAGAGQTATSPSPETGPTPLPMAATRGATDAGDPEAGRAIFFDAANPKRCATCHQFQGRGADVGPDLTSLSARAPRDIARDILEPDARLAVEPVAVLTKTGERLTGLKKQENRELIRIYVTQSFPPILRTIYKDQIDTIAPARHSPMPDDYGRVFTRKQLLDLVAFLKSAPVAPGEIQ